MMLEYSPMDNLPEGRLQLSHPLCPKPVRQIFPLDTGRHWLLKADLHFDVPVLTEH